MVTVTGIGRNLDPPGRQVRSNIQGWFLAGTLGVIVVAVLVGVTLLTYQAERDQERAAAMQELNSVSALKVRLIRTWRDERLLDAKAITRSPGFVGSVSRLVHPERPASTTYAAAWVDIADDLTRFAAKGTYPNVYLVDPSGRTLHGTTPGDGTMIPETRHLFEQVIEHGAPLIGEPYIDRRADRVHIDVAGPVVDAAGETLAVLVLRIDPTRALFPDILAWPGASDTAESVLVRRDHDQVVVLSPLHTSGPGAFMTIPTTRTEVAAVAAATGPGGAFEGVDHQGEPVFARLRWVGGSRWALVTKVAISEVRERSDQAGIDLVIRTILLLLLVVVLGVIAHLARQRRLLGRLVLAERDRADAAERYDRLLALVPEIMFLVDSEGRIVEVNAAAAAAYGYDAATLRGMTLQQLRTPEAAGTIERDWTAASALHGDLFETDHRRADGTTFQAEVTSRSVVIGGVTYRESMVRDISTRKRADQELRRQVEELRRWRAGAIGREGRILELKAEVNAALAATGQPARYRSVIDGADADDA